MGWGLVWLRLGRRWGGCGGAGCRGRVLTAESARGAIRGRWGTAKCRVWAIVPSLRRSPIRLTRCAGVDGGGDAGVRGWTLAMISHAGNKAVMATDGTESLEHLSEAIRNEMWAGSMWAVHDHDITLIRSQLGVPQNP